MLSKSTPAPLCKGSCHEVTEGLSEIMVLILSERLGVLSGGQAA